MNKNRTAALDMILVSEGPELNISPNEPGGASKYGVSVDFLTDYNKTVGKPRATVAAISDLTEADARVIYSSMLLDKLRFDELPSGVDYRFIDIATNLGMSGGPKLLQLCLRMWPLTNQMDDATITNVGKEDPTSLVKMLSAAWIAKKAESPNWGPSPVTKSGYGHGWTNRNVAATQAALLLVGK